MNLDRPLAFVDIDGVLNREVSNNVAKKRRLTRRVAGVGGSEVRVWLDLPGDTRRLRTLGDTFELAWGTWWEEWANHSIAPLLHLGPLPIVAKAEPGEDYKAWGIIRAAVGRPFVWFEDTLGEESLMAELDPPQPHKVILVNPRQGLTDEHVEAAVNWSNSIR